jgi:hypothetical protein
MFPGSKRTPTLTRDLLDMINLRITSLLFQMVKAVVHTPYYDWDGRKYIEFMIENRITRVKIPFRYNRVMCHVTGMKTVQEFQKGDEVEVSIGYKMWDGEKYLVLESISEI